MGVGSWILAACVVAGVAMFACNRKKATAIGENDNGGSEPGMDEDFASLQDEARQLAAVLGDVFTAVEKELKPGLSTQEIDAIVAKELNARSIESSFRGYNEFPAFTTTSINHETINALPSSRKLEDGDLLKLQIGVHGASTFAMQAWTYEIGAVSQEDHRLYTTALEALELGIAQAKVGFRTGDIGLAIQEKVVGAGYQVNRDFVGHRVGRLQHSEPPIPAYGRAGTGKRLRAGWILSLNVIVHSGDAGVNILDDEWTAVSIDGKNSVHFSKMVILGEADTETITVGRVRSEQAN